ncbi:periplasmic binding protein-like II [Sistotremastrum niveocremeum HHB9708]|uniref:Periplasmic binding protein-like II n=2 Tax=Sistotremastraceae TaxID=3402574 RepID=A0A164TQY0_9AGAM|nr:periplasmic binding protein-like II [Sistotremastrum niveocremeum HHB9708]KZT42236.1 periplasmic binding protein-like II [Sistotremastrum suecicum HHB10207 ss-3]
MPLRVGSVFAAHVASPLLQFADDDHGRTFTLTECPGTGELIDGLADDTFDLVIAPTETTIVGIAKGDAPYRLVGSYVTSPMNWAVMTGKDSQVQSIDDLKGANIGISKPGSADQIMAYVLALQHGWLESPRTLSVNFHVGDDFAGSVKSLNDGVTSACLWEWFSIKSLHDKGRIRIVGSLLTPWPSWMIAARNSSEHVSHSEIRRFCATLTQYVRSFDSADKRQKENIEFLKTRLGYPEEDARAWMLTAGFPEDCTAIPGKVITDTLNVLVSAGVLTRPTEGFNPEDFTLKDVMRLV